MQTYTIVSFIQINQFCCKAWVFLFLLWEVPKISWMEISYSTSCSSFKFNLHRHLEKKEGEEGGWIAELTFSLLPTSSWNKSYLIPPDTCACILKWYLLAYFEYKRLSDNLIGTAGTANVYLTTKHGKLGFRQSRKLKVEFIQTFQRCLHFHWF